MKSKRIDFLVSNCLSLIEIHHLLHFWSRKSLYLYMPFKNFQGQQTLVHTEYTESYETDAVALQNFDSALGLRWGDRLHAAMPPLSHTTQLFLMNSICF